MYTLNDSTEYTASFFFFFFNERDNSIVNGTIKDLIN